MTKIFLSIVLFFSFVSSAADFVIDKKGKCKISQVPNASKLSVYWHGACVNGMADGEGVARYLKGSKVESVFYGLVKAGYWSQGVHDVDGGYVAGRFEKNQLAQSLVANGTDDRNVIIKSFEIASKAALQISKEYELAKNKASAKHYKAQADKLAQQMD